MKIITIRQLHETTGKWVRAATSLGELHVTERGRIVAKLVPASPPPAQPYFGRRKLTRRYRAISRFLVGGRDSTTTISEDRDHVVP